MPACPYDRRGAHLSSKFESKKLKANQLGTYEQSSGIKEIYDGLILIGNFDRFNLIYYIDRLILMRLF